MSEGAVGLSTTPDFCLALSRVSMLVVLAIDGRDPVGMGRTIADVALETVAGCAAGLATAGGGTLTTDVTSGAGGATALMMASS